MIERTYRVVGMSCEHCAQAVTSELQRLAEVTGVDVDLTSGEVRVRSDQALDQEAVRAAVDEAGYEVVG